MLRIALEVPVLLENENDTKDSRVGCAVSIPIPVLGKEKLQVFEL